ncbi:MAG: hypothetical protein K2X11_09850 [Acetobacteraceae bacterium]|nr:hypothetical protein [Acetobacteraceae bacterium]
MRTPKHPRAAALAGLLALAACAAQPLPPWATLPRDAILGAGDPMRAAIIETAATFEGAAPSPAQAARAAAMIEWMATDVRWGGRWSEYAPYVGPKLAEAQAELRDHLGVPVTAPPQLVVDGLFAASWGLRRSLPPALPAAAFPDPGRTLSNLAALPDLPRTKEATALLRNELGRVENDRLLNQNTGGGSGRD